jgi:LPS O-antigen subunit length determinant protein (WzzB/FepE family)
VDRGMTMIESKDVEDSVIKAADLYNAYKLDASKSKDRNAMHERYRASFEAKRTENASIMCFYKDTDPARSAKVLDLIVQITDYKFREYLSIVKNNSEERVNKKIANMTDEINIYTDSLVKLRNQYQIFDLISPNRQNTQIGSINGSGKNNAAEGIEVIQNLEALKDQLVIARADLQSTATELKTDKMDEVKLFYYVSTPSEPNKPHGLGFILTVVASVLVAFFFSVLLFSLSSYIKALSNTNR